MTPCWYTVKVHGRFRLGTVPSDDKHEFCWIEAHRRGTHDGCLRAVKANARNEFVLSIFTIHLYLNTSKTLRSVHIFQRKDHTQNQNVASTFKTPGNNNISYILRQTSRCEKDTQEVRIQAVSHD